MIPFKTLLSTLLLASAAHAADSLHVVDETIVTGSRLEIPSTNTAATAPTARIKPASSASLACSENST